MTDQIPSELKSVTFDQITEVAKQKAVLLDDLFTMTRMYTTKTGKKYSKQQVKRGNTLKFVDCYQGKRQGLICCFNAPDLDCDIEVPLQEVPSNVMGWQVFLDAILDTSGKASWDEIAEYDDPQFGAFA